MIEVQSANARVPRVTTLVPRVTVKRDVQDSNADVFTVFTLLGISIEVNAVLPWNAPVPMLVNVSGNNMLVNAVFLNALFPILDTSVPILIVVNDVQFSNR